jgi:hypothetical protein
MRAPDGGGSLLLNTDSKILNRCGPCQACGRHGSAGEGLSPASHFANRDQPDAWNRAALEFLAKVDARRRR